MGGNRSSCPGKRGEQGSSLIYVILSITLLSVFSCGYMAISRYQMKSVLTERTYMEAQITAKTIHSTFCEAVSSGNSQAINSIWQCFEEDCRMVREEYDEMMEGHHSGHGSSDTQDLDTAFAEGMVMHHQMAVDMAETIIKYSDNDSVTNYANSVIELQGQEISQMQDFLDGKNGSGNTHWH